MFGVPRLFCAGCDANEKQPRFIDAFCQGEAKQQSIRFLTKCCKVVATCETCNHNRSKTTQSVVFVMQPSQKYSRRSRAKRKKKETFFRIRFLTARSM